MLLAATLMTTALLAPEGIPSPDTTDARCVVAMASHAEKATGEDLAAFNGVMFYFVGKLAGRHSPDEVSALVGAADKEAGSLDLTAIGKVCASEMERMGNVIQGL